MQNPMSESTWLLKKKKPHQTTNTKKHKKGKKEWMHHTSKTVLKNMFIPNCKDSLCNTIKNNGTNTREGIVYFTEYWLLEMLIV